MRRILPAFVMGLAGVCAIPGSAVAQTDLPPTLPATTRPAAPQDRERAEPVIAEAAPETGVAVTARPTPRDTSKKADPLSNFFTSVVSVVSDETSVIGTDAFRGFLGRSVYFAVKTAVAKTEEKDESVAAGATPAERLIALSNAKQFRSSAEALGKLLTSGGGLSARMVWFRNIKGNSGREHAMSLSANAGSLGGPSDASNGRGRFVGGAEFTTVSSLPVFTLPGDQKPAAALRLTGRAVANFVEGQSLAPDARGHVAFAQASIELRTGDHVVLALGATYIVESELRRYWQPFHFTFGGFR